MQLHFLAALALPLVACQSMPKVAETRSADGVWIVYDERGPTRASGDEVGAPLVLVHGWSCDRTHWSEVAPTLAERHRVVTLDLAGHGESGADRKAWSIAAEATDVVAVLDALDLTNAILIGHSMGGPVCLAAAHERPKRVRAVIGVEALHDADAELDAEAMRQVMEAFETDFLGTNERYVASMFQPGADPELLARVMHGVRGTDLGAALALMRGFFDYRLADALRATPVPVYAVNSSSGRPTNVEGNRRYARWFDVRLMDDVGHFPMLEAPERFLPLLQELIADAEAREPAVLRTL